MIDVLDRELPELTGADRDRLAKRIADAVPVDLVAGVIAKAAATQLRAHGVRDPDDVIAVDIASQAAMCVCGELSDDESDNESDNEPAGENAMQSYTATYEPHAMNGERGHNWRLYTGGKLIAEGWTRGKKRHAEDEVKIAIAALDQKGASRRFDDSHVDVEF